MAAVPFIAADTPSASSSAFLQERMVLFSHTLLGAFVAFTVLSNTTLFLSEHMTLRELLVCSTNAPAFVLIGVIAIARWGLMGGTWSLDALRAVDTILFGTLALGLIVLGTVHFVPAHRDTLLLISLIGLIMSRVAVVPSSTLRTAVLSGGAMIAATTAIVARHIMRIDGPASVDPVYAGTLAGAFGVCVTVSTAFFSGLIFRLQGEVNRMRRLGQYTLLEKVGEGGMGQVFRAKHERLKRPTAIKLVRPSLGEESVARFEREVQLTARLRHPNTVTIYDYGRTDDGVFYYAMEYVGGLNLQELVHLEGEQPAARVVHLLRQVVGSLEEAHGLGLVHRDIKPSNIVVSYRDGVGDNATVLDFGLVKQCDEGETLTQVGQIVGTPAYMAPESLLSPDTVDPRSDLYAVGAVAYFLLTGHPVFEGSSIVDIMNKHLNVLPEPPSALAEQRIGRDLEALVLRCLHKNPDMRPQSASELLDALDACGMADRWSAAHARVSWSDVPEVIPGEIVEFARSA